MHSSAAVLASFAATAKPKPRLKTVVVPAVADCFSYILAGARSVVAERTRSALSCLGRGDAPAYGTASRFSASHAALVNAVAGHAWDLDDWEEPGNTHPSIVLVPALLATACLRPASGSDLLSAYAVGSEIIMRLGEAMSLTHYTRGFHSTATLGALGAAGAVGRLLQLPESRLTHAFAIAVSQAIGYTLQFGSNAKPLQAGFASRAGLESAVLAERGVTGELAVLDHKRGFAGRLGDISADRFKQMQSKLGCPWALEEFGLLLKPWPCCSYIHRLLTAALELRPKLHGRLESVASIYAVLPDFHLAILPYHRPATRGEALFSVPACVGQVLATGGLTLADSEVKFWESPDTARLMRLVEVIDEPAANPLRNYDPDQPDELQIRLDNGEKVATKCAYPLGAPQNPLTKDQLGVKYHSITGRPSEEFQKLLDWVEAPDVAKFFAEKAK